MKTLTKLILAIACVCFLMACSKSNDDPIVAKKQLKSSENKTFVYKDYEQGYWSPVICDGVQVDVLTGTINSNVVEHLENGLLKWYMIKWSGTVVSEINHEEFVVHESDKISIPIPDTYTYHFNLVGNMGSHYINSGTVNMNDWTITVDKSVCHGN